MSQPRGAFFGSWIIAFGCLAGPLYSAYGEANGPVVGLEAWTVNHPEIKGGHGLSDSLMHHLVPQVRGCKGKITEWARRRDVVNEVEFQQSKYVDKSTATEVGQLLQPDLVISGQLNGDAQSFSWAVQLKDAITGELLLEDKGKAPAGEILTFDKAVADRMSKKICESEVGYAISGQMDEGTVSGTICGKLDKSFTAVSPEVGGTWNFTPSSELGGSFTYAASNVGGVPGSGGGTYKILKSGNTAQAIKLSGSGAIHSPLGTFTAAIGETLTLTPIKTCGRRGRT